MRSFIYSLCLTALIITLTGCGDETNAEMMARMKPEYDAMREKLSEVAALISDHPEDPVKPAVPLDPVPRHDAGDVSASNTEFLMYENLTDPDLEVDSQTTINLRYASKLMLYLRWTGDKSPLGAAAQKRAASPESRAAAEAILKTRYLAVAKAGEFTPVKVVGPKTYAGGVMTMSVYLVDLETMKVVSSFGLKGTPPAKVNFEYKPDDDPQQRMIAWARSGIFTSLREQFIEEFENSTGGSFVPD